MSALQQAEQAYADAMMAEVEVAMRRARMKLQLRQCPELHGAIQPAIDQLGTILQERADAVAATKAAFEFHTERSRLTT